MQVRLAQVQGLRVHGRLWHPYHRPRQLEVLNNSYTETEIVRKFLQATLARYLQIVMAIETLLDLDTLSVEELIGRLKAVEERYDLSSGGGGS